jgi:hypothetical protein
MSLATIIGGLIAYPINRWLVALAIRIVIGAIGAYI